MKNIRDFILKYFEASLICLILFGVLAIGFLVHFKFSFLNFFFLPVILAGYFLGKKEAVLTGFLCVLLVIFYLLFSKLLAGAGVGLTLDEGITLVTWSSFLILIAAIIGMLSEQRQARLKNMYRAYIAVLDILLKYLETADEAKPKSLRISHLSGKIAGAVGLDRREIENIKSAALLFEAGDLRANLPLFEEISQFIGTDVKTSQPILEDRETVLLQTTVSLLREVEPILEAYQHHYVQEAIILDKDLGKIPIGSSIIALADIYDRIERNAPPYQNREEFNSINNLLKLAGRTFPESAVNALQIVISS
ncbi:MAG: hypothetical protein JXB23_14890 [Candidatus Aminicenantes bacterium]|nr:hypothetical protein [Candidatus Aminicenantes bacterium]